MDLTKYLQNLRDDLLTAASVGDENARNAAAMLAGALEPAARLAIMNALSDLAAEVTGALQDTTVELRLDGRDVRVAVTRHTEDPATSSRQDDSYFTKRNNDARQRILRQPPPRMRLRTISGTPCRTPAASSPGPRCGCSTS